MIDTIMNVEEPLPDCPWFNLGRNPECKCKEYVKKLSVLVLVEPSCQQHGYEILATD